MRSPYPRRYYEGDNADAVDVAAPPMTRARRDDSRTRK